VSSSTWTPRAVAAKAAPATVRLVRAVEAQHVASTRRLVDNLDEQHVLERVLEASKPPVPEAASRLHYLLFTPFRYPSPYGSRFRASTDPGVFYGAESVRTACAELGYWRWRFLKASPALASLGPAPQTLFQATVKTLAVDLEAKPFVRDATLWRAPDDYAATQACARTAREAGVGLIRYASVRDPQPGRCGAVLDPRAFHPPQPVAPTETWILTVTQEHAVWQRDRDAFEFDMRGWGKPG